MTANPIFEEGIRIYFGNGRRSRLFAACAGLLLVILLLAWPKNDFVFFLRAGTSPQTYQIVAFSALVLVLFCAVRFGVQGRSLMYGFAEWLRFARVPWSVFFRGKLLFVTLHNLAIVGVALPFLVAAAAAGGVPPGIAYDTALAMFFVAMQVRLVGMALVSVLESRRFFLYLSYWLFIALVLLATPRLAPALNPVISVYQLSTGARATGILGWAAWNFGLCAAAGAAALLGVRACASAENRRETPGTEEPGP